MGSGKWILPGGGLHAKEKPIEGVLRELKEETGLKINSENVQASGKKRTTNSGISADYYLFKSKLSKKQSLQKQKLEIIEAKWLKIERAKRDISELADLIK